MKKLIIIALLFLTAGVYSQSITPNISGKANLSGATFTGAVLLTNDSDYVDASAGASATITGTGQKGVLYVDNIVVIAGQSFNLTFNDAVITTTSSVIVNLRNPTTTEYTPNPPYIHTFAKQNGQIKIAVYNPHPTDNFEADFIIDYLILP